MIVLKTFKEKWENSDKLLADFKDMFESDTSEIFKDNNWFIKQSKFWQIVWNVFNAKTYAKYFIWNDETGELEAMTVGLFLPTLWTEIINFYKQQLPLLTNDLNELKDWKSRGSQETGTRNRDGSSTGSGSSKTNETRKNEEAETRYSQPTANGYKWDNEKDAPTSKEVSDASADRNITTEEQATRKEKDDYEKNMSNRMNDLTNMLNKRLNIYLLNIFFKFEYMFINKYDANKYLGE